MGQTLQASNTAMGKSYRAGDTEESKRQLSLGTSECWEWESQDSIPAHRLTGLAGQQRTESRKLCWGRDCETS